MPHSRPKTAVVIAVLGALLIILTLVAAADVGYLHRGVPSLLPAHHEGHVYAHFLGDWPELGVAFALAMWFTAAHAGIKEDGLRRTISALTSLAGVGLLLLLAAVGLVAGDLETDGVTVATSAQFDVVRYERSEFAGPQQTVLHLRTARGILSDEGDMDLACFAVHTDPPWVFDHARVVGPDTVEVTAQDGTTWAIRFDPLTLRPVNPVDRCTDAPDYSYD